MTDDEFLRAFAACTLGNHEFRHRDHLRLAWLQVRRLGPEKAAEAVAEGIRRFAAAHGADGKYHETMTRFWVRVVAHMSAARSDIRDFDQFLSVFPMLLDKNLPFRHWQRETMLSPAARAAWVEPDILPMPLSPPDTDTRPGSR
jgi:hypothetical protein